MKNLHNKLRKIWYANHAHSFLNPSILFLGFLSLLYRSIIHLRNRFYDMGILTQEKLPCKVISVGNITVGGMGKTPTVILLANLMREQGYKPAVLSRGYGGKATPAINIVSDGSRVLMGHEEAGDEPVLIAKSAAGIPVLTGPKRVITGRAAVKDFGVDLLILDDAFQHRSIFRNIDIVLLDREKPFGNGFLLPGGPLREPPEALKRADLLIWKDRIIDGRYPQYQEQGIGCFLPVFSGHLKPKALIRGNTGETLALEHIRGKKILAFAGIGSPESFVKTIESLGGIIVTFLPFPDHHLYTLSDISEIRKITSSSHAEIIMTTEKDAIRLTAFSDFLQAVLILRVEMKMLPSQEAFSAWIMERLK